LLPLSQHLFSSSIHPARLATDEQSCLDKRVTFLDRSSSRLCLSCSFFNRSSSRSLDLSVLDASFSALVRLAVGGDVLHEDSGTLGSAGAFGFGEATGTIFLQGKDNSSDDGSALRLRKAGSLDEGGSMFVMLSHSSMGSGIIVW